MERLHGVDWRPGTFRRYESYLRERARQAISGPTSLERSWRESWLNAYSEYLNKTPRDFHEEVMLPCLMLDFADALERCLQTIRFLRQHPARTAALCQLIYHVKHRTGRWHDPEVRTLVAAVENRHDDYDISAHAKWRSRHEALISRIGALEVYPRQLPH